MSYVFRYLDTYEYYVVKMYHVCVHAYAHDYMYTTCMHSLLVPSILWACFLPAHPSNLHTCHTQVSDIRRCLFEWWLFILVIH